MTISRRQVFNGVAAAATATIASEVLPPAARAQVKQKIRLVILDIGGTIIEDHGEVPNAMHNALAKRGVEASFGEIGEWRGASKREMVRHFVQLRTGAAKQSLIAEIYDDFTNQVKKAYANVRPIKGAEAAITQMRRDGYILATTTGFDRPITQMILGQLGWQRYFVASITSDDVVDGRPAPFMLFHAMEAAHVDNVAAAIAVGDTPLDLQAGNNARMGAVIGVTSGAATEERLRAEMSTHILPSVASLPDLLRNGV
jgi:phosphonatase-like hydrolase